MPKKVGRTGHRPGAARRTQRPRPRPVASTAVIEPAEDLDLAPAEAGVPIPERTSAAGARTAPNRVEAAPARSARSGTAPRSAARAAYTPDDYRYLRRDLRQVVVLAGAIILAMLVLWFLHQAGVVALV